MGSYRSYATVRIVGSVLICCLLVWGAYKGAQYIEKRAAIAQREAKVAKHAAEKTNGKIVRGDYTQITETFFPEEDLKSKPKGWAFVRASILPLAFELDERMLGWRPNDIFSFSDDRANFQKGVLEVTRKSVGILKEKITYTDETQEFDPHLAKAMQGLMIDPERFWFPSPESKYRDALDALNGFMLKLENEEIIFDAGSRNLLLLLEAFEELISACDENLVKAMEAGKAPVRRSKADDYFYYAKGIAAAMGTVLQGMQADFDKTLALRSNRDMLQKAVDACLRAADIHPVVVTESSLSGVLANHRANMAAPISQARYYIGKLIKAFS